jgi:hypothetical protein
VNRFIGMPLSEKYLLNEFNSGATTINTPLSEIKLRKEFVKIYSFNDCLRKLGFAARYVSGYLETLPPKESKMQGSDASHAWVSVYVPEAGEFDLQTI